MQPSYNLFLLLVHVIELTGDAQIDTEQQPAEVQQTQHSHACPESLHDGLVETMRRRLRHGPWSMGSLGGTGIQVLVEAVEDGKGDEEVDAVKGGA